MTEKTNSCVPSRTPLEEAIMYKLSRSQALSWPIEELLSEINMDSRAAITNLINSGQLKLTNDWRISKP